MKKLCVLLLALLVFFGYRYYKLSPPDDILEKLEEIRVEFKEVYDKSGDASVVAVNATFFPANTLSGSGEEIVDSLMDQIGAYRTVGACHYNECYVTVYVGKLLRLRWLGPVKYYTYTRSGVLEEEKVSDIDEAIEKNEDEYYAFCEKTESEKWFYCENNH